MTQDPQLAMLVRAIASVNKANLLYTNTTFGEAVLQVHYLWQRAQYDRAHVESGERLQAPLSPRLAIGSRAAWHGQPWALALAVSVADACDCYLVKPDRLVLIDGAVADAEAAVTLFQWLHPAIADIATTYHRQELRKRRLEPRFKESWRHGLAQGTGQLLSWSHVNAVRLLKRHTAAFEAERAVKRDLISPDRLTVGEQAEDNDAFKAGWQYALKALHLRETAGAD